MARYSLLRASAGLLACVGLLVLNSGTAAAQAPPGDQPPGLERLWSEYPLNPDTTEAPIESSPRSVQPRSVGPRLAPSGEPPEDRGRGPSPWSPGTLSILAATLAGLTAVVAVIIMILAGRPALLHAFAARNPVRRRRQEGGVHMSDVFRKIRGRGDPHRDESSAPSSREGQPVPDDESARVGAFQPHFLERSTPVDMKSQEPRGRVESDEARSGGERELATAAQVGEHVTAVITSAQHAAELMRREAAAETDQLRAEAREEIEARIAEANREAGEMRADAEAYSREARQDADAYAGEKRGEAEAYASRVRAEAEENSREMRGAANQEAERIEKEARRRREALTGEVERFEERLHSLHTVFQGITLQLEALLSKEPEPEPERAEQPAQETLADALKPNASRQAPV